MEVLSQLYHEPNPGTILAGDIMNRLGRVEKQVGEILPSLGRVEEAIYNLSSSLQEMKTDVREMKDDLVSTKTLALSHTDKIEFLETKQQDNDEFHQESLKTALKKAEDIATESCKEARERRNSLLKLIGGLIASVGAGALLTWLGFK